MSAAELISDMLSLLGSSGDWCQGANAKDADDKPCSPLSPNAVKWDLYGALIKAQGTNNNFTFFHEAYSILRSKIPGGFRNQDIESWNDTLDHSDILTALS